MVNVLGLTVGTRVDLVDGRQVTVEENIGDGMWVSAREDASADTELVHAQDILRVAQD